MTIPFFLRVIVQSFKFKLLETSAHINFDIIFDTREQQTRTTKKRKTFSDAVKMQNAKSAPVANDFNDTCFHWDGVGATMNGARHHFVQQKRYLFKKKMRVIANAIKLLQACIYKSANTGLFLTSSVALSIV